MNKQIIALVVALVVALPFPASATRIKDISTISGMRENQLIGYGLMVGLKNTGDRSYKTPFTIQTLLAMLKRLGTTVDIRQITGGNMGESDTRRLRDVRVENVAAVMITATLSPFARPGAKMDIRVSSLGDARSLEGGTLLLTPLKGADGKVYAVAQGDLPVQKRLKTRRARKASVPTSGTISGGAIVEKTVATNFMGKSKFNLLLNSPDFTTANSIVARLNETFGDKTARGLDAGTVEMKLPAKYKGNPFGFVSELETLRIQKDSVAKIVLNEKNGTVIIGENVEINSVAISFGDTTLTVRSPFEKVEEVAKKEKLNVIGKNADINELVRALNALGVSPSDLVSIFMSLRASGALNAEVEVL